MTTIEVGKPVPIKVQITDGRAGLKVMATILDDIGKQIDSVTLSDAGGGFYFDNSFLMPDVPSVSAQISVDEPDLNGEPYAKGIETFYSKPKVAPKEKEIFGEVVERVKFEEIVGVIDETENQE